MQRDMELVRKILLQVESLPAGSNAFVPAEVDGYEQQVVAEHIALLESGRMVEAASPRMHGGHTLLPRRLTRDGYDFLDAARNDNIWSKAKEQVGDGFSSLPLSVLKDLLTKLAADSVGL